MVKINFYKNLLKFSKKRDQIIHSLSNKLKKTNVYIEYKIRELSLHFGKWQQDVFFYFDSMDFLIKKQHPSNFFLNWKYFLLFEYSDMSFNLIKKKSVFSI